MADQSGSPPTWFIRRLTTGPLTARRAAAIISFFTFTLTLLAATAAFWLDRDDFPNFGIAVWWAVQTVTTVGYGDFVPHNTEGRIIGAVVMLGGISFVAVVTASIAAALVEAARNRRSDAPGDDPVLERLDEIFARLDRLERSVRSSPSAGEER